MVMKSAHSHHPLAPDAPEHYHVTRFAGENTGRQSIITGGGHDILQDVLMLGTGHGEEEGTIEHALMLLELLMRHLDVANMFTQQVSIAPHIRNPIVMRSCFAGATLASDRSAVAISCNIGHDCSSARGLVRAVLDYTCSPRRFCRALPLKIHQRLSAVVSDFPFASVCSCGCVALLCPHAAAP
jgi:hypothetical protein